MSKGLSKRILEACKEMGYYGPNTVARSLGTGQTKIIGIYTSGSFHKNNTDPLAHHFLEGVCEVFEKDRYSMLHFFTE